IAMADIPLFVDTVLSQQIPASEIALVSGLALLRMTAMIPLGAILGGWLCNRLSCRLVGILGLLFTAAGFYLMSRWPMNVDWTQITISTLTAGLGFGLVIAPISTTAIHAVRANQAGMGSAIVTALRMVGMILGLAALTSWGLSYFKQLASQFPPLSGKATPEEFSKWTHDYANHLVSAAHTVYGSIFFTTMILCVIAIVPAIFLWGTKPAMENSEDFADDADLYSALTVPGPAVLGATAVLEDPMLGPPAPPFARGNGNFGGPGGPGGNSRRRLIFALIVVALAMLLVGTGLAAVVFWPSSSTSGNGVAANQDGTATPASGPRMIQLALNDVALTSIFVSQLGLSDGTLSNIKAEPQPNDGLLLKLNLNIHSNGIDRVMPVELQTTIGTDAKQNLQLKVLHLKRDGLDAGPAAAATMQGALNKLMLEALMPALRGQLQSAQLVSVHTSAGLGCSKGAQMLVLLIKAPPVPGMAAQPTPSAICFLKPVDLNHLLG
ncbi:MAG TPA: hypothetical protein VFN35_30075, partial [Ktedonobacteraceae bacterium]|nr:hypothetical protein [Ktedonobacteraceae bacterium]